MRFVLAMMVAAVCVASCQEAKPKETTRAAVLPKGTTVKLMLMRQIESGVTDTGTEVPFVVAEDVKDNQGAILIPKGHAASGKVTWSRREGTFSGLVNQPARLAVSIDGTKGVDGTAVPLATDLDENDEEAYQFTRGNTGRAAASQKIEELLKDEAGRKMLEGVSTYLEEGNLEELVTTEDGKALLTQVASQLNLTETNRLVQENKLGTLGSLLKDIKSGSPIAALTSGEVGLALAAVSELAGVAEEVGSKLSRMMRGRNIKAYIGTPIEAKVEKDVTIQVKTGQ